VHDAGIAAACLLAAFRPDTETSTDEDEVRAYVGALLILDGIRELTQIRKALSSWG
jgi:hypothetical protein